MKTHKVIVVGGGPAGLVTAALLASEGQDVAVVAPAARPDGRTVALMEPSLRLLAYIALWPGDVQSNCAALRELHIFDDTGNTVSAPPIAFAARELGLDAFGWNVPMMDLVPALEALCASKGVQRYQTAVTALKMDGNLATLSCDNGEAITAKLVIAADGGSSAVRKLAGIATRDTIYEQAALVCRFAHSASHKNISTEWHKSAGPFTTVPLPGNHSSLVWMAKPDQIAAKADMSPEHLAREIQLESHGILGRVSDVTGVQVIPMKLRAADQLTAQRVVLIGEAAHQMPPIGAQGLNLSMRDAGHISDIVLAHDDPGSAKALAEYSGLRRPETLMRQTSVGVLNWSLLTEFAPASLLRAAGLAAVGTIPFLRQFALQSGIAENTTLPFAMRKSAQ